MVATVPHHTWHKCIVLVHVPFKLDCCNIKLSTLMFASATLSIGYYRALSCAKAVCRWCVTGQSPTPCPPTSSPPPLTAGTKSLSTRTTSTVAGNHVTFCLPPENDTRQQRLSSTTNAATSASDIEDDCCDRFLRNHLADVSTWLHLVVVVSYIAIAYVLSPLIRNPSKNYHKLSVCRDLVSNDLKPTAHIG